MPVALQPTEVVGMSVPQKRYNPMPCHPINGMSSFLVCNSICQICNYILLDTVSCLKFEMFFALRLLIPPPLVLITI